MKRIKIIGMLMFLVFAIMIVKGYSQNVGENIVGYKIEYYDPYLLQIHTSSVSIPDGIRINVQLKHSYDYVLDGYIVYDVVKDVHFDTTHYPNRSVNEINPVVYRGFIPITLERGENKTFTVDISFKDLKLSKGDYYIKVYVFKDRQSIVGNYISFKGVRGGEIRFRVDKDYGDVPSIMINRMKTHIVGGYGQSGPVIYSHTLPKDFKVPAVVSFMSLRDINPSDFAVEVYICKWSDMDLFLHDLTNLSHCEYFNTYHLTDKKGDIRIDYPISLFNWPANQIVYILKDKNGIIHDIWESRLIKDEPVVNLVQLNYYPEWKKHKIKVEVVLTGPYEPYRAEAQDQNVNICVNDECEGEHITSLYTDNVKVIRKELSLNDTSNKLCVETPYEKVCKEIRKEITERSPSKNIKGINYTVIFVVAAIIVLILVYVFFKTRKGGKK